MNGGPLIVQSDKTLLLDVDHPDADECRLAIAAFAELERSPEHMHTYRLTPLGLWNARAAGHEPSDVVAALERFSRYPIPQAVLIDVADVMSRYGRLMLEASDEGRLLLRARELPVLEEVLRSKHVAPLVGARRDVMTVDVPISARGRLKQALIKAGWPVEDRAGHVQGAVHAMQLLEGEGFALRDYQRQAVSNYWAGGSGVVVLPCGEGKTLVGAGAMARSGAQTLILVANTVAARQWRRELLARTSLQDCDIGEYSGDTKEIRPVTIATYQIIITRRRGEYHHLELFSAQDWGLIIYDEVHLLPAPVFRIAAEIQSRRRLGLTATLVREDGRADDVFSLIGPKRYDAPWRDMESQGWIAPAVCTEVRVTLSEHERMACAMADETEDHHRLAMSAASKNAVVRRICALHRDEPTLVIGQYIDQLEELARQLQAPLITGRTSNRDRERLYDAFRAGDERLLVVSRVANFSIDLPEAAVAVQVSGLFGSRQEEAQRLGRILRPKHDGRQAHFYAVVSRHTSDQEFAARRQRFLAEQGYAYTIIDAEDLMPAERMSAKEFSASA